jgi:hypothetical protein
VAKTAGVGDGTAAQLSSDERAAIRAYLQRSEVRLSTMHRVASALLSGAGLMVLLPAVERDAVVTVVRSLLTGRVDTVHVLLLVSVTASLALPFTALWLVLRDLSQFYFHANHLRSGGSESFTPRFTLTALRLPAGELTDENRRALDAARNDRSNVELLVPANEAARRRLDQRIDAYGLGGDGLRDDHARAAALFELAASRSRTLLDEVAKIEHGMTRHVLRTQVIVLRYVKALLALLTTALAMLALAAVVDHGQAVDGHAVGGGALVWLAAILAIWGPIVVFAVTAPVRWLNRLLRNEGADHTAIADDPELTLVEGVTSRLSLVGFLAAAIGMLVAFGGQDIQSRTVVIGAVVLVASLLALVGILWASSDGHPIRRMVSLHS